MAATSASRSEEGTLRYDPSRDARWLLLRPWLSIPRLIQILWALLSLGLKLLIRGSSNDPEVQRNLARSLLRTLTDLGPCFIKVGQALSTRPDLIRRDWLDELTRLQDDLPAFPHAIALATIEADLGSPVEQLFADFPEAPVAAASLGQVYRARLHGQHWVAVKVQRPNLPFILRRDMVLIRTLGVLSAPFLPLNLGFGLGEIIDEFGRSLFEEIDYGLEANNAERFAALFADNPAVTIPKVDSWNETAGPPGTESPKTRPHGADSHGRDQRPAATAGVRLFPCRPPSRQSLCPQWSQWRSGPCGLC